MSCGTRSFKILQYNVQKSYTVMAALLRDPQVLQFDVIAIQEPWLNSFDRSRTHNPTQGRFFVYMNTTEGRPLVCFLIRDTIDKSTIRVTGCGANISTLQIRTEIEGRDAK